MENENDKLTAALNNVANQIGLLEVKFSRYIDELQVLSKEVTMLKSELLTTLMQINLLWGVLLGGSTILALKWFTSVDYPTNRVPSTTQSAPHKVCDTYQQKLATTNLTNNKYVNFKVCIPNHISQ